MHDEVAAFALNVAAAEAQVLPAGLGEMRFAHVSRSFADVRTWLRRARRGFRGADEAARAEYIDVARDVNRAFAGCVDRGLLLPTARVPMCRPRSRPRFVVGPEGLACSALDDECNRGFERVEGCCDASPRPDGTSCSTGWCQAGRCVDDASLAPANTHSARGTEHHIDIARGGAGSITFPDYPEGRQIEIAIEGIRTATVAPIGEEPLDLSSVRVARVGELVAVLSATPADAALHLTPGDDSRVCVATQAPTDGSPLSLECDGSGAVELPCPGEQGGLACSIGEDGLATVRGEGVWLAWPVGYLPADGPREAIALSGVCISTPFGELCFRRPPFTQRQCRPGQLRACRRCNAPGIQVCNPLGRYGPCIGVDRPMDEACNGNDDDCDGVVDEDTDDTCDDGLNCTQDRCNPLTNSCNSLQNSCFRPDNVGGCAAWRCLRDTACAPVPGNQCLNYTCNADGSCTATPNHGLCAGSNPPVICGVCETPPCDAQTLFWTCDPVDGQCKEPTCPM